MRKLALILITSLISYVGFGQVTKKLPYQFDNNVTINDSLKIGDSSNLKDYGKFLKVDSLSNGTYYLSVDTVPDAVETLPYDSITSRPFKSAGGGWEVIDSSLNLKVGGANDTTRASVYAKYGIQRGVNQLDPDESVINGSLGSIFYVNANTGATAITSFTEVDEGSIITIKGLSSGNTTTISTTADIILTGASPITLNDNVLIRFLVTKDSGGNLILLELNRN